jgi:ATP-dependent Clp protease adaptor protein ClpS
MRYSENTRLTLEGSDEGSSSDDGNLAVAEAKPKLKRPSLYKIFLMNDDFTPMEFVVEVLQLFFYMDREKATQIMLAVHTEGRGVCGVYPHDVAETKMIQINDFSRNNEHPLLCQIEAAD